MISLSSITIKNFFQAEVDTMGEQLAILAKNGDKGALAKLLQENYSIVFKTMLKFTLDKTIAEDLTQEAMVKAIEKFHKYNPKKSKFSTWLIQIAKNLYLDKLRKNKLEYNYIQNNIKDHSDFTEGLYYNINDELIDVAKKLKELDDNLRIPIILKYYYGYTNKEIGKKLSVPEGTVKSRIHNGLKLLRGNIYE